MTEARQKASAVRFLPLLRRYLGQYPSRVVVLSVLLLLSIGLQLANPLNLRAFLDAAATGAPSERMRQLGILFFVLAVVQQLAALATAYLGEDLGWRATNRMRADLAGHLLRLDMSFHNSRTPGELIERIDGDITALANFFSHFVIQVVGNSLLLAGVLALLFAEDWRIGAALAVFIIVTIAALLRVRTLGSPHWRAQRQASAEQFGFLEERIGGTEDIRANGARHYVLARFAALQAALGRRELAAGLITSTLINVGWVLFAIGNALAFLLSAWLYGRGELSIGVAYLVFYYTNLIVRPIERLMNELEDFQRAVASIGRVQALFGIRSRLVDGTETLPDGPLEVVFDNVTFGYRDEPSAAERRAQEQAESGESARAPHAPEVIVLHGVSFRVAPGNVLGLLGRTGSGKTTISRLLARMYDPTSGCVCLSGHELTGLRLGDLRRHVGVVTQNVQLFHASVRDNLTLFSADISDERVLAVLADLGLDTWLDGLPRGLDTLLAPAGSGLSAGEGQLLAFARIFLHQPGLVILDEASSRLDPATEQRIEHALDRLLRDRANPRTALIIAHRLATVQRADDILILNHGHIAEYGKRAMLAADPQSRFAQLLRTGLAEVLE